MGDNLKDKMKEIDALCEEYKLDVRSKSSLMQRMTKRLDTFEEDMATLFDVLKEARNPPGLLAVKLKQMDEGNFQVRDEVKNRLLNQKRREEAAKQKEAEAAKN